MKVFYTSLLKGLSNFNFVWELFIDLLPLILIVFVVSLTIHFIRKLNDWYFWHSDEYADYEVEQAEKAGYYKGTPWE